jgi:hypothetical protein
MAEQKVQENSVPEGHITLREASKISGYTPDYVGQLIRKGKLYGRQVYINVAWVTTEEALREYMEKEKSGGGAVEEVSRSVMALWQRTINRFLSEARLSLLLRGVLYFSMSIAIFFAIILFYVLSVNIEQSLQREAVERAMQIQ